MKIAILANRDFAACYALNQLLPELCERHDVQLILSSRTNYKAKENGESRLDELQHLETTCLDRVDDLQSISLPEQATYWKGFVQLARKCGREHWICNKLNAEEEMGKLAGFAPDLVISIRYSVILRSAVLAIPKHGVINLHSGLLPEYRGVMATFWALLNGEQHIGSTLHYIDDASIDTGRIIACSSMPVQPERSYWWHMLALYDGGCKTILDAVGQIAGGQLPQTQAQKGKGNYYSFPEHEHLSAFEEKGLKLFDDDDAQRMNQVFGI